MGWLDRFRGHVIGLDTAPLIYFIEEHPEFHDSATEFFEGLDRGEFTVVTSVLTLAEVLVQPFRREEAGLVETYRQLLMTSEGIRIVPVSDAICVEAARLRARYNLRTPDAIQIATALTEGATFFLTADRRLKNVKDLTVVFL